MRVNVYAEEITVETEMVMKEDVVAGEQRTFYGVRFYLKSPRELHHTGMDDDRSAVTIFVPWTLKDGYDFEAVREILLNLDDSLDAAQQHALEEQEESRS